MFCSRVPWCLLLKKRFKVVESRMSICSKPSTSNNTNKAGLSLTNYDTAYQQFDKLDFLTAAKILFTGPLRKGNLGLISTWYNSSLYACLLWVYQFTCLTVYLVAQYARYEIRRMEEELEQKKKIEEEEKAKKVELAANDEKEAGSIPELLEVKERLDKLEETVKRNCGCVKEAIRHRAGVRLTKCKDASESCKSLYRSKFQELFDHIRILSMRHYNQI
ncbi:hypothetical protein FNV43_RR02165 [Rhamnella rubrinervis]|uniref:Uncharacterized protein n=1 Tax=Rhamnella rubrinervis TaxID=2594499 RepID=A0A8K0MT01_9ROSA|nr:hypothetical protein FNV43_RR02165 [Rhamnella rubrinervis]